MILVQNLKTTLWSGFGGNTPRDRPLENLSGGGGSGKVQRNYSRKGKLNEKIGACQVSLKYSHAMA